MILVMKYLVDLVKQVCTYNILVTLIFIHMYLCICIAPGIVVVLDTVRNMIIWSPPLQPNGIITGYQVIYSIYQNDSDRISETLSNDTTRYIIEGLGKYSVNNIKQNSWVVKE